MQENSSFTRRIAAIVTGYDDPRLPIDLNTMVDRIINVPELNDDERTELFMCLAAHAFTLAVRSEINRHYESFMNDNESAVRNFILAEDDLFDPEERVSFTEIVRLRHTILHRAMIGLRNIAPVVYDLEFENAIRAEMWERQLEASFASRDIVVFLRNIISLCAMYLRILSRPHNANATR